MIYLGSDHAGFELKEEVRKFLKKKAYKIEDLGAFKFRKNDDYPDYIFPVAMKVAENPNKNKGIIFGGSGQGEAMLANKVKGIRAIVYYGGSKEIIKLSRIHNNANILSIGACFISSKRAKEVIILWLKTKFKGEKRHLRRINKIKKIENKK